MNEPNFWEMLLGFAIIFVSMGYGNFLARRRQAERREERAKTAHQNKLERNARKKSSRQHKSH